MEVHFLQSKIWRDFQVSLGRQLVEGSGNGWSYVGLVEHDRFGTYIYIPYGPSAKNVTALRKAAEDITKKARKLGAYVVYVEPTRPITKKAAAKVFSHRGIHRQAHRTIKIDLKDDEETLLLNMQKTRRKQFRNYDKKGLTITKDNSKKALDTFYELLTISAREKGFYVRSKEFFERLHDTLVATDNASLFTATRDGRVEVAALIYDDADTRYYAHVGRDLSDNSLQASAPLITYMIMDAKKAGKKYFDLYGISESDDKIDEKSGFTAFKKSFGGEVIEFGGAWEIPIKPVMHGLKNSLRVVQRLKKRLLSR